MNLKELAQMMLYGGVETVQVVLKTPPTEEDLKYTNGIYKDGVLTVRLKRIGWYDTLNNMNISSLARIEKSYEEAIERIASKYEQLAEPYKSQPYYKKGKDRYDGSYTYTEMTTEDKEWLLRHAHPRDAAIVKEMVIGQYSDKWGNVTKTGLNKYEVLNIVTPILQFPVLSDKNTTIAIPALLYSLKSYTCYICVHEVNSIRTYYNSSHKMDTRTKDKDGNTIDEYKRAIRPTIRNVEEIRAYILGEISRWERLLISDIEPIKTLSYKEMLNRSSIIPEEVFIETISIQEPIDAEYMDIKGEERAELNAYTKRIQNGSSEIWELAADNSEHATSRFYELWRLRHDNLNSYCDLAYEEAPRKTQKKKQQKQGKLVVHYNTVNYPKYS